MESPKTIKVMTFYKNENNLKITSSENIYDPVSFLRTRRLNTFSNEKVHVWNDYVLILETDNRLIIYSVIS